MERESELPPSEAPRFFYRFRSIDALLGERQELERQQIYLASPEQLNDPMEGYREVFWDGDEILWRNLIRNYVGCLASACAQAVIMGPDDPNLPVIHPIEGLSDLPREGFQQTVRTICDQVLADGDVKAMASVLPKLGPLNRAAVTTSIRMVHLAVVEMVLTAFADRGLAPKVSFERERIREVPEFFQLLPEVVKRRDTPIDALFEVAEHIRSQLDLVGQFNHREQTPSPWRPYLILDFPDVYVDRAVDTLIHPPWYTACFADHCSNASMWGTYGDGHKGVALRFDAEPVKDEEPGMLLFHGIDSPKAGDRPEMRVPFSKVTYSPEAPRVDFFRSMGRLSRAKIRQDWETDEELGISSALGSVGDDDWRDAHWKQLLSSTTQKHPDWRHEGEYRLVWPDLFGGLNENQRKVTYKFSSLSGLVFGMRTALSDRVAIAEIIERKCRAEGREQFEFSEARYSSRKQSIEIVPLKLLRFNVNES